ncbi:MAG: elongation factor P maturation arginine rhamnosyltransferase EarP [Rhodocyclaceae bacterium]|nr:elongation factor P maturation arginine rhamnosyltransferase EarP [Rhodocyclaceae bacterium]
MAETRPDPRPTWDVFCRVVDNFGDIGVCRRLCLSLARDHDIAVRLITDQPELLQRMDEPTAIAAESPIGAPFRVIRWCSSLIPEATTAVVIEAFACELPEGYSRQMASDGRRRLWINLEYLSAEPWVEGCHGLVSRHPELGLDKVFVFPGFTGGTGGLLRESGLLARRDAFTADPDAQAAFWQGLGLDAPAGAERRVCLFGYENPAAIALLDVMAGDESPWTVVVPEDRSATQVAAWAGSPLARPGDSAVVGALRVVRVPFMAQDRFDQLLWACDLNLVRGEDSLVRALWAARPFLWQAYVQPDDAHLDKVAALATAFARGVAPAGLPGTYLSSLQAWNGTDGGEGDWTGFLHKLPALAAATRRWSEVLAVGPELAGSLVELSKAHV